MTTAEYPATRVVDSHEEADSRTVAAPSIHRIRVVRNVALALSIYGALRILIFVLAFPLFNTVDEKLHFLTIQMYAQGHFPERDLPHIDSEFVRTFLPYWSPEYTSTPEFIKRIGPTPLYQLSLPDRNAELAHGYYAFKLEDLPQRLNFEAQGAPLYYLISAPWYKLGTALGLREWRLVYWLRLLNPISYGLLVWLSYSFVQLVYPDNPFLCIAVPALIAVFPQDVFFGMNRDVLPPTLWAAALLLMVDTVASEKNRYRSLLWASFLVGLAFLLELSSCVLYGALAVTLALWLNRSRLTLRTKIEMVGASAAASAILPALWLARNYFVLGDLTGTRAKMANFGWTVRPFADVLHHPMFTWQGLAYFLVKLTRNFWRGDYLWHGVPMQSAGLDWFYVLSSALLILIFAIDFIRRRKTLSVLQQWTGLTSLLLVVGSICFMAAVSMIPNYGDNTYPSRLHPFFYSGRIISGALLPFVLMYATGLGFITRPFRRWVPPLAVLACLLLFITASEIHVRRDIFGSPYNFFALVGWHH